MKRSPGKDPEPVSTEKHPPSVNLVVGICEDGVFCSMVHFLPTVHIPCSKLLLKDTREAWNGHFGNEYYWRTDVSLKKFLKKRRAGRRMTKKSLMQRLEDQGVDVKRPLNWDVPCQNMDRCKKLVENKGKVSKKHL